MWGKPPISIDDNYAVDVRDLAAAQRWYEERFGLKNAKLQREDDSGRPFVDLQISNGSGILTLIELESGGQPSTEHVIFTAKSLEKARTWMEERGIETEPITSDSGGNEFFYIHDLDGNRIEVGNAG